MKGYKAYEKGLICEPDKNHRMQYEVGKEYEMEGDIFPCNSGFHFCENPLDTLRYYPLVDEDGNITEITEVEALGEIKQEKTKFCTTKIKIGVKLDLSAFMKASIDFIFKKTKASSGYRAQLASSGYRAQLASSGNCAQLASSGNDAQLASSGYDARLASSGYRAQLASSGNDAQLASSGNDAQLASSGYDARLASSGYDAQLASSGNCARLASSGNCARLASSGNCARLASSGNCAQLASSGNDSVVAGVGVGNIAKAKKGSWIVLAEWKDGKPVCVKAVQVDGEIVKEDKFYVLKNGEFVEVGNEG